MYDILPFPNITGETPAEQLEQINSYLIQLKEELEFALTRISVDNLSEDLRKQLASLGADISTNRTEQEVVTQQIINRALTVDDVISSTAFENALKGVEEKIPTDYVDSKELEDSVKGVTEAIPTKFIVTASDSDDGIVFQTASEGDKILKITVDYETGYLNYTI